MQKYCDPFISSQCNTDALALKSFFAFTELFMVLLSSTYQTCLLFITQQAAYWPEINYICADIQKQTQNLFVHTGLHSIAECVF